MLKLWKREGRLFSGVLFSSTEVVVVMGVRVKNCPKIFGQFGWGKQCHRWIGWCLLKGEKINESLGRYKLDFFR